MSRTDRTRGLAVGAGQWSRAARRLRADRFGLAFVALLVALALAFLAAPLYASLVAGTGPNETHITDTVRVDGRDIDVVALDGTPTGPTLRPAFLLGADASGRDLAVRLLYGGRNSLVVGLAAALTSIVLGAAAGLLAGYAGGRTDAAVSRALDVVWSFPVLLAGVAVGTTLALQDARFASKAVTALLIGVVSTPYAARPIRARVLSMRNEPFIDAARMSGAGPVRVMVRELLPNLSFTLVALFTVLFANAIVLEAALSFLGAGVRPPEASFGTMLNDGLLRFTVSPHLLIGPTVALTVTVLAVTLVGDALRRALDPHAALTRPPS
jgi:peptide/nickel transport system permease protein